jgi:hypothetical protein
MSGTSTWTNSGYYLLANSPYDPDYGNFTTRQVSAGYWASKMANTPGFYKKCLVEKIEVKFTFTDPSATPYKFYVGFTDDVTPFTTTSSDANALTGQPMIKGIQSSSGNGTSEISGWVYPWDIIGMTREQYSNVGPYECNYGSVASTPLYIVFGFGRIDDAVFGATVTQYVTMNIRYHCRLRDLVEA